MVDQILEIPRPFSKSKFNLKSDRVIFFAPASPIECLLYLPNVRTIQYKLGPEMLTRLGNSNVLRLPVLIKENMAVFTKMERRRKVRK